MFSQVVDFLVEAYPSASTVNWPTTLTVAVAKQHHGVVKVRHTHSSSNQRS